MPGPVPAEPGSSASGIVVQKYGGTSVADPEGRQALTERVRARLEAGDRVVCVVSAMGRAPSPYATDTLLGLVSASKAGDRERDRLAACGEIISSAVVADTLMDAGVPALSLSGVEAGVYTDGRYGCAEITGVDPASVATALDQGLVPVIAGFQGMSAEGDLTTLDRGGSDTSACALAAALGADEVEIYTDVEGVLTADPRILPSAEVLEVLDYDELFQMAKHGARVVHAPAAELARDAHIPLRIRSTFSGAPGTLVAGADTVAALGVTRVATAVSHVDGIARVVVDLPHDDGDGMHMEVQTRVYRTMADARISLDMFTPLGDVLVFSVAQERLGPTERALADLGLTHRIDRDLAKVTLIGAGMHGVPGVMARLAEALNGAGVTALQTADSHATISVLVWQNRRDEAVRALHEAFGLGETARDQDPAGARRGR